MKKPVDIEIINDISRIIKYHTDLGIKEYPLTPGLEHFLNKMKESSPEQPENKPRHRLDKTSEPREKKHVFDPGLAEKATLQDVMEEIGDCQRCPLCKTRRNIVFGHGSAAAKLLIVADAPGRDDDKNSAPLQGDAGNLLDRMLTAIGLSREEVYITFLVKCFPGHRAKPRENETKTCLPFLFRQIEIICPSVICTMGMLAAQTMLHSRKSLFQLRGRFYNFNDLCSSELEEKIVLMPSLHPELLLENTDLKKASWKDLQMIQKKLQNT
ncbi:MAG: uracil-DNA glycosylase [Desulfobulbales bacterium]|nr:uracil-DNA glycosylase [Desulfobulbales bacterium]